MPANERHRASFRDPSGFLFSREGVLFRQINRVYADHYARLMESGLYEKLVESGLLIPHIESGQIPADPESCHKVIQPERVPFISYPYEWSFSQLKDAALATLSIQKLALKSGMILKDASAYNMQFGHGRVMLVDTLSFETYTEGRPWEAYRQFCQHFLAPLALMSFRDVRLNQLMRVYIDGLPLDLAGKLLPLQTRMDFGLLAHIHLHAEAQKRFADKELNLRSVKMSRQAMVGLIDSLEAAVKKLTWHPPGTEWADYYDHTNYTDSAFQHKRQLVRTWVEESKPATVLDLGANTGVFSREAASSGATVIAFDIDPVAVEKNYLRVKMDKERGILPLVLDLTNPSPSLGWDNRERDSFAVRGHAEMLLALALIHHLAISNNVPLSRLSEFFALHTSKRLVIEFVPKTDPQVQKLLATRRDIFVDYTREGFEKAFTERFKILRAEPLAESGRILYLMEVRQAM